MQKSESFCLARFIFAYRRPDDKEMDNVRFRSVHFLVHASICTFLGLCQILKETKARFTSPDWEVWYGMTTNDPHHPFIQMEKGEQGEFYKSFQNMLKD